MNKPPKIIIKPANDSKRTKSTRRKRSKSKLVPLFLIVGILAVVGALFIYLTSQDNRGAVPLPILPGPDTVLGIDMNHYNQQTITISASQKMQTLLIEAGVEQRVVYELQKKADELGIELEPNYTFKHLLPHDPDQHHPLFIYAIEENLRYAIIRPYPSASIEIREKPSQIIEETRGIIVKDSILGDELTVLPNGVVRDMEIALQWSIDFLHILPGDKFKFIYDKQVVDNKVVNVKLKAVYFENKAKTQKHYAFYFKGQEEGFFDQNAKSMKRSFLMSPVAYGRISSGFNLERMHPVEHEKRPHYGTDFAAPAGTPIRSVADGKVIRLAYVDTPDNKSGIFVKIRHDDVYQTAYLHMSRIADGIKRGTVVKQGQTIGYVGETGLTTGPHVCFHFWKGKKRINHLTADLEQTYELSETDKTLFMPLQTELRAKIDDVSYD